MSEVCLEACIPCLCCELFEVGEMLRDAKSYVREVCESVGAKVSDVHIVVYNWPSSRINCCEFLSA